MVLDGAPVLRQHSFFFETKREHVKGLVTTANCRHMHPPHCGGIGMRAQGFCIENSWEFSAGVPAMAYHTYGQSTLIISETSESTQDQAAFNYNTRKCWKTLAKELPGDTQFQELGPLLLHLEGFERYLGQVQCHLLWHELLFVWFAFWTANSSLEFEEYCQNHVHGREQLW